MSDAKKNHPPPCEAVKKFPVPPDAESKKVVPLKVSGPPPRRKLWTLPYLNCSIIKNGNAFSISQVTLICLVPKPYTKSTRCWDTYSSMVYAAWSYWICYRETGWTSQHYKGMVWLFLLLLKFDRNTCIKCARCAQKRTTPCTHHWCDAGEL